MSDFEPAQTQVFDPNAAARVEALKRFNILDTDRDAVFDGIAELAAALFDAPVVIVNFIADDRQWFKAEIGIGQRELPLDDSICLLALPERGIFVVPDLTRDARFANNPQVVAVGGARFYAGAVLESEGVPIGTVCVLDRKPRPEGITNVQRRGLEALAVQTMAALERSAIARRDRFRLSLSEALLAAEDANDIMSVAARMIGEYLGVAQVGFGIVEEGQEYATVAREWNDGRMPTFAGRWCLDDFGPDRVAALKAGHTLAIDHIHAEDRSARAVAAAPYELAIRSALTVPLVRNNALAAVLFAYHPDARVWQDSEIELVEDCAARLWSAVIRERDQAALQVSEDRAREYATTLSLAVSAAKGGAYSWNIAADQVRRQYSESHILSANGDRPDTFEEIVRGVHPEDQPHFRASVEAALANSLVDHHAEYRVVQRDGTVNWIADWGRVERSDDGTPVWLFGFAMDITARKRAEDAQMALAARLEQAQDLGGIGTWEWDRSIGAGVVSKSYRNLFGMAPDGESVTNAEMLAIMHPDDHATFNASVERGLATGERITVDYRFILPTGEVRNMRGVGQRVGGAGSSKTAGIVEDITERVTIEAMLQDRAARLSLLSRIAAKLVLTGAQAHKLLCEIFTDIAERIGVEIYFNYQLGDEPDTLMMASSGGLDDAVRAHFARLRFGEQLCGTVAETRTPLIIEDLQKSENPKAAEFKSAGATCYAGYPLLADGELMGTIAFASRKRVHFAPGDLELIDTVCHLVAAALAREQLETGLQRANTQLETKVATRTADLVSANRALKAEIKRRAAAQAALIHGQKLEALGQLTSGIAHDFNNILASIAGGMSLIERSTDDDKIKVLTGHCQDAAFKGAKLVKQMLAFARQEVLAPSAVSLAGLAEEVRPLISQAIPGNVIVIDFPADLPKVHIDAVMLETALLNLAVNARDAMPGGGNLSITATTSQPGDPGHPLELAAAPAVAIAVRDDGTGMPPEVVQRVTEPFFTTKAPGTGTGLGLAMVYGFVTQSGGALRIQSRPKQGTTVTLYLPFAGDADIAPSPETVTQAEAARPGIGAIMLVDDDPTVRAIAAAQLRDLGYTVTAADGLAGAMALIDAGAVFDCVVSDVVMPGGDGIALAEAIRATQPALPILFMTGRADNARVAGETVVPKPFKIGELAGAVATAIARPAQEAATLEKIGARCRSRCVADMLDRWRTSKTVSKVPRFGDFDPDICAEPHRLAIIKADPAQLPMRFEVVSAGKELEALLGRPLHGTELDVRGLDGFGSIEESYRRAVKSGLPVFDTMRMDFGDGTPERFERIIVPYSSNGQITDRLVSVVVFATENIENEKEDRP